MMLALLLYAYAIGERSSWRIERRCEDDGDVESRRGSPCRLIDDRREMRSYHGPQISAQRTRCICRQLAHVLDDAIERPKVSPRSAAASKRSTMRALTRQGSTGSSIADFAGSGWALRTTSSGKAPRSTTVTGTWSFDIRSSSYNR